MAKLKSTNPAKDYEVVGEVEISTDSDIKKAVASAQGATKAWGELSVAERVELMKPLSDKLLAKKEELAKLITQEVGKPITEARESVDDSASNVTYYLTAAVKYLNDEVIKDFEGDKNIVRREPWGVAAVISPWNWPLQMPVWGIIPALVTGNTVIFKPSEESPLVAQKFADLIYELALPKGAFSIIQGDSEVGKKLINGDIDLIHFTGSARAGQEIFSKAGKKFIKAIVELGGSSPVVIFEDVKIDEEFIDGLFAERFYNCGQVCTAMKRLIVHKDIFDAIVEGLVAKIKTIKVGDPMEEDTDIGSLVAKRQLELLEQQVADAVGKGAKVEIGGSQPDGLEGAYYLPTILTKVTRDMRVMREEVFGPVLPIITFENEQEAIEMANDTDYGLSARIFTEDKEGAMRVAGKIEAGRVSINSFNWGAMHCPFGGYKKSGMGREHGRWGFEELTQVKHIMIKK